MGVRVSQVKPLNCLRLHSASMISKCYDFSQQFRFLAACRRLEKLVLPSIFDRSLILDDVKLAVILTTVLNERMWHFRGSQHTLTFYIFSGDEDLPNIPRIYTPPCWVYWSGSFTGLYACCSTSSVRALEGQYQLQVKLAVMPCGWEGNHRSVVVLATRHRR